MYGPNRGHSPPDFNFTTCTTSERGFVLSTSSKRGGGRGFWALDVSLQSKESLIGSRTALWWESQARRTTLTGPATQRVGRPQTFLSAVVLFSHYTALHGVSRGDGTRAWGRQVSAQAGLPGGVAAMQDRLQRAVLWGERGVMGALGGGGAVAKAPPPPTPAHPPLGPCTKCLAAPICPQICTRACASNSREGPAFSLYQSDFSQWIARPHFLGGGATGPGR